MKTISIMPMDTKKKCKNWKNVTMEANRKYNFGVLIFALCTSYAHL